MKKFRLAPFKDQDKLEEIIILRSLISADKTKQCGWNEENKYYDNDGNLLSVAPKEKQDKLKHEGLVKLVDGKYIPFDNIKEVEHTGEVGGRCFVATAVYGNQNAKEVEILRDYRDGVLRKSFIGRKLIQIYYSGIGEKSAEILKNNLPSTIPIVRMGLDYLVDKYSNKQ